MPETKKTSEQITGAYLLKSPRQRAGLLLLLCFLLCGSISCIRTNLTGSWIGSDNGMYYIRQVGNDVWWVGFSSESQFGSSDIHRGLQFTSVFHGTLNGGTLTGNFVDVPKGQMSTSGPLTLSWNQINELESIAVPGAYRATSWKRFPHYLPPLDVFSLFNEVKKNQNAWDDHSLLDNLKPAKTMPVSILGRITNQPNSSSPNGIDPYVIKMAYPPPPAGTTYNDFICLDGNNSPPDGDLNFDIHVDRGALDQQIGFWTAGWETSHGVNADNFGNKLNVKNTLHAEVIMYGGTTECGVSGATTLLAPGWQQPGSLSALLNGVPIDGQVAYSGPLDTDGMSVQATSVLGVPIGWNSFVRVNGVLALDCGHGAAHDCNETDSSYQNQEIHPVYSIDLIQDFSQPRAFADLTGVWAADDAGTYYLRQDGNTVWWLGLSTDEGLTFANIFQGTLQNNQISGNWVDIQLGQIAQTADAGAISLNGNNGALSFVMNRLNETGGISAVNWQKLYDAGGRTIIIVLDQAQFDSSSWPKTGEELEIQVGPTRINVKPQNPRIVKLPDGRQVMLADIPKRIPVDAPELGGLRMSAQFAGYRANWKLLEEDFKSGKHVQPMTPPRALHDDAAPTEKEKESASAKKIASTALKERPTAHGSLPTLTIRYHIEPADPSGRDRLPK
jgi:hypothetical protein